MRVRASSRGGYVTASASDRRSHTVAGACGRCSRSQHRRRRLVRTQRAGEAAATCVCCFRLSHAEDAVPAVGAGRVARARGARLQQPRVVSLQLRDAVAQHPDIMFHLGVGVRVTAL